MFLIKLYRSNFKRKYDNIDALKDFIEHYFNSITTDTILRDEEGNEVLNNNGDPVIVTVYHQDPDKISLAKYLGIDIRTLESYRNIDDEYKSVIDLAYTECEAYASGQLGRKDGQVTGYIFKLKNHHGYVDKQEVDQRTTLEVKRLEDLI